MIATVLFALLAASSQTEQLGGEPELQCHIGPATRNFGGNDWIVYACEDGQSVVVAAGAPNPATPFYFIVRPDREGILLYGEGTGDKSATEPAYNALKDMSASDLAELYQQAVVAVVSSQPPNNSFKPNPYRCTACVLFRYASTQSPPRYGSA